MPQALKFTANPATPRPKSLRGFMNGFGLASIAFVGLFSGTAVAQVPVMPEGCFVTTYLSSPSIDSFLIRLAVNGTDIVACADYLELQVVDNRLVLSREGYNRMLEVAGVR